MESNLLVKKFFISTIQVATMRIVPVVEDGDFDKFVEEEEVIYVNGVLRISRDKDGYFCDYM